MTRSPLTLLAILLLAAVLLVTSAQQPHQQPAPRGTLLILSPNGDTLYTRPN